MNIKGERLNRGLSIREAAEAMGVGKNVLLRAEIDGGTHPRHAKRIADFYGVRVTDIWPVEPLESSPGTERAA